MTKNNSLRAQKVRKLQQLKEQGMQTYGYKFDRTHMAKEVALQYEYLNVDQACDDEVFVCGRIMNERFSWRFVDLQDESGSIQLVCMSPFLDEESLKRLRLLDRGDLIGVRGKPMRTRQGPPSISVESWELLAKSVQPLPEDPNFVNDPETRYRNRHLDLILNQKSRDTIRKRCLTIRAIRSFLDHRGYLEMETPILHTQAGGAEARPFTTHHNALGIDMHMRIAPEYYLRRLLVGGFDKVYELGRNFRNEGISTRHNPEFTSIELFAAYGDYLELMDLTEKLLRHAISSACGTARLNYQGTVLAFDKPFARMSMTESIKNVCGIDVDTITNIDRLKAVAESIGVKLTDEETKGEIINAIFEARVQETLIAPTFIMDYPIEVSVCQQRHRTREGFVERFELFVFGRELANGCSELNDPEEQMRRFEFQSRKRERGHEELPAPDKEFVAAMEYGMPPMMGLGIGIDRLIMFIVDAPSIRDVIAFPSMKPLASDASSAATGSSRESTTNAPVRAPANAGVTPAPPGNASSNACVTPAPDGSAAVSQDYAPDLVAAPRIGCC